MYVDYRGYSQPKRRRYRLLGQIRFASEICAEMMRNASETGKNICSERHTLARASKAILSEMSQSKWKLFMKHAEFKMQGMFPGIYARIKSALLHSLHLAKLKMLKKSLLEYMSSEPSQATKGHERPLKDSWHGPWNLYIGVATPACCDWIERR